MNAPLRSSEGDFSFGKGKQRGKKPAAPKHTLNTNDAHHPRYVTANGRTYWRPNAKGWPDVPGSSAATRGATS